MRGIVRLYEGPCWWRGRLLWERENLVVNGGLTALASLLGGVTAGQFVASVGFGSGSTGPLATDTALATNPAYYNAVGTVTIGPSGGIAAGTVQFAYSLVTADYAANPLTIAEMGLFGNTGGVNLPAAIGTANPAWAASQSLRGGQSDRRFEWEYSALHYRQGPRAGRIRPGPR